MTLPPDPFASRASNQQTSDLPDPFGSTNPKSSGPPRRGTPQGELPPNLRDPFGTTTGALGGEWPDAPKGDTASTITLGDRAKNIGAGIAKSAIAIPAGVVDLPVQMAAAADVAGSKVVSGIRTALGLEPLPSRSNEALQGPARFLHEGAQTIAQQGNRLDQFMLPPEQQSFWNTTLPVALGQVGIFAASGALAPYSGVGLTGIGMGGGFNVMETEALGTTQEEQLTAGFLNAALGATEGIPIMRALKMIPGHQKLHGLLPKHLVNNKRVLGPARRTGEILVRAFEEAGQEFVQELGSNVIASEVVAYDPDRPLDQQVYEAAGAGFSVGALLGLVTSAIGVKSRARYMHELRQLREVEQRDPKNFRSVVGPSTPIEEFNRLAAEQERVLGPYQKEGDSLEEGIDFRRSHRLGTISAVDVSTQVEMPDGTSLPLKGRVGAVLPQAELTETPYGFLWETPEKTFGIALLNEKGTGYRLLPKGPQETYFASSKEATQELLGQAGALAQSGKLVQVTPLLDQAPTDPLGRAVYAKGEEAGTQTALGDGAGLVSVLNEGMYATSLRSIRPSYNNKERKTAGELFDSGRSVAILGYDKYQRLARRSRTWITRLKKEMESVKAMPPSSQQAGYLKRVEAAYQRQAGRSLELETKAQAEKEVLAFAELVYNQAASMKPGTKFFVVEDRERNQASVITLPRHQLEYIQLGNLQEILDALKPPPDAAIGLQNRGKLGAEVRKKYREQVLLRIALNILHEGWHSVLHQSFFANLQRMYSPSKPALKGVSAGQQEAVRNLINQLAADYQVWYEKKLNSLHLPGEVRRLLLERAANRLVPWEGIELGRASQPTIGTSATPGPIDYQGEAFLQNAILKMDSAPPGKRTPREWTAWLRNQPGVSPEEFEWNPLLAELNDSSTLVGFENDPAELEKVGAEEFKALLWNSRIRILVGENRLSGGPERKEAAVWRLQQELEDRGIGSSIDGDQDDYFGATVSFYWLDSGKTIVDLDRELAAPSLFLVNQLRRAIQEKSPVEYEEYAPEGFTAIDYGERLYTVPPTQVGLKYYKSGQGDILSYKHGYLSNHFDGTWNLAGWVRWGILVDQRGKNVQVPFEFQSDWHQAGRLGGYSIEPRTDAWYKQENAQADLAEQVHNLNKRRDVLLQEKSKIEEGIAGDPALMGMDQYMDWLDKKETNPRLQEIKLEMTKIDVALKPLINRLRAMESAPSRPKTTFSKNWQEILFKDMLREAVVRGQTAVYWAQGSEVESMFTGTSTVKLYDEILPRYAGKLGKKYGQGIQAVPDLAKTASGRPVKVWKLEITPGLMEFAGNAMPLYSKGVNPDSQNPEHLAYLLGANEFSADLFTTEWLANQANRPDLKGPQKELMERIVADVERARQEVLKKYPVIGALEDFPESGKALMRFLTLEGKIQKIRENADKTRTTRRDAILKLIREVKKKYHDQNLELDENDPKLMMEHLDRFNWFMRIFWNPRQIIKDHAHITGLQDLGNLFSASNNYKLSRIAQMEEIVKTLRALPKEQQARATRFMFDQVKAGKYFTPAEALPYNLSQEAQVAYQKVDGYFRGILDEMQATLTQHYRQLYTDPVEQAVKLEELGKDFDRMREKPYLPYSRFGKYVVGIRDLDGKVVNYQHAETKADAAELHRLATIEASKMGLGYRVYQTKSKDLELSLEGMPVPILRHLKESMPGLTREQIKVIDEVIERNLPAQGFSKHFLRRRGVAGYSEDLQRVISSYAWSAANHLTRIKYYGDMQLALQSVQDEVDVITFEGGNAMARQDIVNYMRQHVDYIMSPSNELPLLRSFTFLWFLGGNIKSAVTNFTQVPLFTYPFLASRYGDIQASKELVRAQKLAAQYYTRPKSLPPDLLGYIEWGISDGHLDQSLAAEVAIAASEGSMDRHYGLPSWQRMYYKLGHWAAIPFHAAEKYNRLITGIAAFNLAKGKNESEFQARNRAAYAVRETQFETMRWNRPVLFQGPKGVFFIFGNFLQNSLHFLMGGDIGALRAWMALALLGGLMGLPGAEDLEELLSGFVTRYKQLMGYKDPYTDLKYEAYRLLEGTWVNPEFVLHGLSRDTMGLRVLQEAIWPSVELPHVDMSASLSMGNIFPGTTVASRLLQGNSGMRTNEALGLLAVEAGGPFTGMTGSLFSGVVGTPDNWKRAELLMPAAARNLSKAFRLAERGEERTAGGVPIAEFDTSDPSVRMELILQGMGFNSARVSQGYENERFVRDAATYYQVWSRDLLASHSKAIYDKNREARADAWNAIEEFNKQVPYPELRITGEMLSRSADSYIERRMKADFTIDPQSKYIRFRRDRLIDREPKEEGEEP